MPAAPARARAGLAVSAMPSLPVFATPSVARDQDPDSKRYRFKPVGGRGGSCCGGINVRWIALGFVLGMLMFAALSVLQVILLDGKDGAFRDAAPGWQLSEPGDQQQEAAEAAQQPEQQPQEQQQAQQQAEQAGQQAAAGQAAEQQEAEESQQQPQEQRQPQEQQQPQQQEQQAQPATAMEQLHSLGIRYHEREPGTPAVGGYDFLPPGDWADKSARRILIYLGANEGAEMDYVINYNRKRRKEYDLAFAFEARPDYNAMWESAVQQRSNPVVHYINKAVWWRNSVLDFGNRDQVGSVLRTKHNDFSDDSRTMQVPGIDFAAWVDSHIRDDDEVTLVSDIQGAEFPVFAHLADSGLAGRIDTLYLECHYLAHSNLIDAISEDSCRQLCLAIAPHVKQFFYWVGPNQDDQIVRGFDFANKPGLQPGDCDSLRVAVPASETTQVSTRS